MTEVSVQRIRSEDPFARSTKRLVGSVQLLFSSLPASRTLLGGFHSAKVLRSLPLSKSLLSDMIEYGTIDDVDTGTCEKTGATSVFKLLFGRQLGLVSKILFTSGRSRFELLGESNKI